MEILKKIKNEVIVSIQAMPDEPLYDENCIIAMAKSVVSLGGAKVLRLAGERDIKNVKKEFSDVIVIGITKPKVIPKNYKELVYITPTVDDCRKIVDAGADIVAFDATLRQRPNSEKLSDLVNFVKSKNKLAMADIATFDEAKNAYNLGCDIVSTTLSGYTAETENLPEKPDFELIKRIKDKLDVFTISEGKIWERKEVEYAFKIGADAVVVGSAITRPQLIFKRLKGV